MLGGAVVTEQVFAWPGLGRLLVQAVGQRDIPLIQGILLLFAAAFVLVNLVVDLLYGFLDPQIRYR
jgi:ABC-type dipeptide/oligopeptide/nickel transport system permease component